MKVFLVLFAIFATVSAQRRIKGGNKAELGQFPFQVALYTYDPKYEYFCGGSLLGNQFILTAAHCFLGENLNQPVTRAVLRLGTTISTQGVEGGLEIQQIIRKDNLFFHGPLGIRGNEMHNDIALFKLDNPIEFTENIKPGVLSSLDGKNKLIVTGWGREDNSKNTQTDLQFIQATLMDENCKMVMLKDYACIKFEENSRLCHGDSGGPILDADTLEIVGIVTGPGSDTLIDDCSLEVTGLITRVDVHKDWILGVTQI